MSEYHSTIGLKAVYYTAIGAEKVGLIKFESKRQANGSWRIKMVSANNLSPIPHVDNVVLTAKQFDNLRDSDNVREFKDFAAEFKARIAGLS
jgi:hypothetical protein